MNQLNMLVNQHVAQLLGQKDLEIASLRAELSMAQAEISRLKQDADGVSERALAD